MDFHCRLGLDHRFRWFGRCRSAYRADGCGHRFEPRQSLPPRAEDHDAHDRLRRRRSYRRHLQGAHCGPCFHARGTNDGPYHGERCPAAYLVGYRHRHFLHRNGLHPHVPAQHLRIFPYRQHSVVLSFRYCVRTRVALFHARYEPPRAVDEAPRAEFLAQDFDWRRYLERTYFPLSAALRRRLRCHHAAHQRRLGLSADQQPLCPPRHGFVGHCGLFCPRFGV